jgi:hypothetical protein
MVEKIRLLGACLLPAMLGALSLAVELSTVLDGDALPRLQARPSSFPGRCEDKEEKLNLLRAEGSGPP